MKTSSMKGRALVRAVLPGAALSLVITAVLTALEAVIVGKLILPMALAPGVSVAVWVLSGFFGSFVAGKRAGQGVLPAALLSGAIYALVLILISTGVYGAGVRGLGKGFASILASAGAAGVLASGGGKNKVKRVRFR